MEIHRMLSPRQTENEAPQFFPQHDGIIREVIERWRNLEGCRGRLRERQIGFVVQHGGRHERLRLHALDDARVHELAHGIGRKKIIFLQLHLDHAIDDLGIPTGSPDRHGVGGNNRVAKTICELERCRTATFIQAHALGKAHPCESLFPEFPGVFAGQADGGGKFGHDGKSGGDEGSAGFFYSSGAIWKMVSCGEMLRRGGFPPGSESGVAGGCGLP